MLSWTTGMVASGKAWTSTDQVPWSIPQLSRSAPIQVGWTTSLISVASAGSPGAGYCTSNSSSGETVEVVNGSRAWHSGDGGRVDVPVRADDQDGAGAGYRTPECLPC